MLRSIAGGRGSIRARAPASSPLRSCPRPAHLPAAAACRAAAPGTSPSPALRRRDNAPRAAVRARASGEAAMVAAVGAVMPLRRIRRSPSRVNGGATRRGRRTAGSSPAKRGGGGPREAWWRGRLDFQLAASAQAAACAFSARSTRSGVIGRWSMRTATASKIALAAQGSADWRTSRRVPSRRRGHRRQAAPER